MIVVKHSFIKKLPCTEAIVYLSERSCNFLRVYKEGVDKFTYLNLKAHHNSLRQAIPN